jgi:hypothetical protein
MSCTDYTISLTQASNRTVKVSVVDQSGLPFDLTGCVGYLQVRQCDTAASASISKTTTVAAQGAIIAPASSGIIEFYFLPADTAALSPSEMLYDAWIRTDDVPAKDYQVVPRSRFVITRRVTQIV